MESVASRPRQDVALEQIGYDGDDRDDRDGGDDGDDGDDGDGVYSAVRASSSSFLGERTTSWRPADRMTPSVSHCESVRLTV